MPKAKPYSGTIEADLASQLLNSTGERVDDELLGDALRSASERLAKLVEMANEKLDGNKFAQIVADSLAADMNRRGNASLTVSETGHVVLHISYEDQKRAKPKATRKRTAPLMAELKERAAKLGVDISRFGIKRKQIHAFLEKVAAGEIEPDAVESAEKPEKKAERKRAEPAKKPEKKAQTGEKTDEKETDSDSAARRQASVRVADDPEEPDPGPMSAGPDETTRSDMPETPPPKRPFVKSEEQVGPVVVASENSEDRAKPPKSQGEGGSGGKGRSMRQLVQDSKEIDIADLLASDSPK